MDEAWSLILRLHKDRLRVVESLRAAEQEGDAQNAGGADLILTRPVDAVLRFLRRHSRKCAAELAAHADSQTDLDPRAAEDALLCHFTSSVLADPRFDESAALLSEPLLSPASDEAVRPSLRMNCSIVSQAFAFWIAALPPTRPPLRLALSAQHAWIVLPATRRAVDLSNPGSPGAMTVSVAELGSSQLFATPHGAPGAASLDPGDGARVLATQRVISDLVALLNGPRAAPAVAEALARVVSEAVAPVADSAGAAAAAVCAAGTTLWLQAGNALAGPLLARCSPQSPASAAAGVARDALCSALRRAYARLCACDAAAEREVARAGEAVLGRGGSAVLAPGLALLRGGDRMDQPRSPIPALALAAACLVVAHSRSPPFLSPLRDLAHLCAEAVALVGAAGRREWVEAARGARAALLQRTNSEFGAVVTADGVSASRCFARGDGPGGEAEAEAEGPCLSLAHRAALDVHRADALLCASLVAGRAGHGGAGEHLPHDDPLRVLCVLRLVRSLVREPKLDSGVSGVCPDRLVGDAPGSGDAAFLARYEWLLGHAVAACDDGSALPPVPERDEEAPDTGIPGTTGLPAPWWEGVTAGEALELAGGVYQVRQHQQAGTAFLDASADWHREGMQAWEALGVPRGLCARAAPPQGGAVDGTTSSAPQVKGDKEGKEEEEEEEEEGAVDTALLPAFSCLTCGVARGALCANCAQHCHRALGHDVTAVGCKRGVWCGCGHHALFASACLLSAPTAAASGTADPGLVADPAPSAAAMRQCSSFGYRAHPPRYCLPGARCQLGGVDRLGAEAAKGGVAVCWPAGSAALAWEQDGDSYLIQVSEGNEAGVLEMLQCGECAEWYHPCCAFPTRAGYEEWKWMGQDDGFTCPLCQGEPQREAEAVERRSRPRSESHERLAADETAGRVGQPQ